MAGKVIYRIFDFCDWNTFLTWRRVNRLLKKYDWGLTAWKDESTNEEVFTCNIKRWCKYKKSKSCPLTNKFRLKARKNITIEFSRILELF